MPKAKREKPISLPEYRDAEKQVREEQERAVTGFESARARGDLPEAQQWCESLQVSLDRVLELRAKLSPIDLFTVKYNITIMNDHAISLVIPAGMSRGEVIQEAQELVQECHGMSAIEPSSLRHWLIHPEFHELSLSPLKLAIDGCVEGSQLKERSQQKMLSDLGLELASLSDFTVAHAAFYAVTGCDLILRDMVRCRDGVLVLLSAGLAYSGPLDGFTKSKISATAYIPEAPERRS